MSAKVILVFCAQAFFIQSSLSQCTSRAAVAAAPGIAATTLATPYGLVTPALETPWELTAPALAYDGLATPWAYDDRIDCTGRGLAYDAMYPAIAPAMDFTPTRGGALPVTSASAIAPVGISVESENIYEGILAAAGELPFVSSVAVEGVLPTAGDGAINHACGNGINAMVSETTAFAPGYPAAIAPAAAISPFAAIAPATAIAPAAGIASLAGIAPGFTAPALGYRAGWAGCGYAL